MAEGGPGRGRGGRGAIIARLLEMQQKPGQPPAGDSPPPPPAAQEVPEPPIQRPIGGRGAILQRLQQQALEKAQQEPTPPIPTEPLPQPPARPMGRGMLLERAMMGRGQAPPQAPPQAAPQLPPQAPPQAPPATPPTVPTEPQPSTRSESDVGGVTRQFRQMRVNHDKPPVIMRGTDGSQVRATANYIRLDLQPGRAIYEYEVRFSPAVDDRIMVNNLLFVQHKELSGKKTFDGVTLYVPHRIPEESTQLTSLHPITKETHTISLIFKRERSMGECLHMYNVLFKNIQRELNMVQLGREYYSSDLAHMIPQHKLEVWPGYITAVEYYEDGIMLNCNASHKVLRTETVLDRLELIVHSGGGRDWKEQFQRELIGQSVMTKRPVNIYRIDDIDFTQNPTSSFLKPDGTSMNYIEYHRRKGIEITDLRQPLLVHRPKPSKRPGGSGLLMLIPELCFMTGLTDDQRSNFTLMKDVANFTRVNPNQRMRALQKFIKNIKDSPNCVRLLDEWGLKVPEQTVELTARTLNPEQIFFKNGVDRGSSQADWGRSATSKDMLETVNVIDWLVVYTQRDERNADSFIQTMMKVSPQLGVQIEYPTIQRIQNDRTETYLKSLKEGINGKTQVVVVIFPTSRDDRYSAIKKLCCVDRPIPSQVINSRTISRPDKIRSIVQKIALQVNCKLGGALWAVKIPFKNAMICGIDSYHDSKTRSQSVAGFVASMNPQVTRWHSQVFIMSSDREMVDGLGSAVHTALRKYNQINGQPPDTIVVFRDGVGDGQLSVCAEFEIPAMQKAFSTHSPNYKPDFAFIICQKRINTRIFVPSRNGEFENPPPGSIVDHTITRRYYHDFFLVSQLVRQGTVTPTHYVVLHNSTRFDADKIQKLTYKMCHLYYNWPGTIRVPAPCQYAHKLAHLVGTSIHSTPAEVLCDKLFFL